MGYMSLKTVTNPLIEEGQFVEGKVLKLEQAKELDEDGKPTENFYDRYLVVIATSGEVVKFSLNRHVKKAFQIFGENNIYDYLEKIPFEKRKVKIICIKSKTDTEYPHLDIQIDSEVVMQIAGV